MNDYASLLESMMNALLKNETKSAGIFRGKKDFSVENQLAVYVESYRSRFHKVISRIYPALQYYLGKQQFHSLIDDFIHTNPSRHYNIDTYAVGFGRYVDDTSKDFFTRELASLESIMRDLYHDVETPALEKSWLKQQTPESLANMPLQLRTASCLFAFSYPVSEYITALEEGEKPGKPNADSNYLIILRDDDQIQRVPLEEAEFILLARMADGCTLSQAMASEQFSRFVDEKTNENFQKWFAHWVSEGFFRIPE